MKDLYKELEKDVRYIEGLKACINCGTCTAICPAAAVTDYDPRIMIDTVQTKDEGKLIELLKSDTIWKCAECLSCKTRCPRGNVPGYVIQALRALSIETGYFTASKQGPKQLALKRTIGEHILKYGYAVYIDEVNTEMYPEQGPVWNWIRKNKKELMQRLGVSYKKKQAGALRDIPEESINDLNRIFEETGAIKRFKKLEDDCAILARKQGMDSKNEDYFRHLFNDSTD